MAAFSVTDANWNTPVTYSPDTQSKAQDSFLERKMIARRRVTPGDLSSGAEQASGLSYRLGKVGASMNQAVLSPANGSALFNKMRVYSEQKLGRAALGYLIKQNSQNLNDPDVVANILDQLHPGLPPAHNASDREKNEYTLKQQKSNDFWVEFLHSPEGRKAANTTTYLHTHAHHANGFATKLTLRLGRLAGELGHVILAPSTLFTKMYRYTLDGLGNSNSLLKSAMYSLGTLTTLSLLAAYKVSHAAAMIPFSMLVLCPLYTAAAVSCLVGKALDSASYHLKPKKTLDSKTLTSMREGAQNRLMEQLTNLAKLQNHLATKTGDNDQIMVDMAKDYANEKMNSKGKTLTGRIGRAAGNQVFSPEFREAQAQVGKLNETLLLSRLPDETAHIAQREMASVFSVTAQIVSTYKDGIESLSPGEVTDRNKSKLLKTGLRSMGSAVEVFSGPHCKGINAIHARQDDMDRYYRPGEKGYDPDRPYKIRLGDHPFPDKQVREHLEGLGAILFDKVRLTAAQALCLVSNTKLHKSNKSTVYNRFGYEVKEYKGLRGAIHRSARLISMNADTSKSNPLHTNVPAGLRRFVMQKPGHKMYVVKQSRESARRPAPAGSLKDIGLHPERYSRTTQVLYGAHKKLELVAEKYLQPSRGKLGRFYDSTFRQYVTGSLGKPTSHYMCHAASIATWGLGISANLIIQEASPLSWYPPFLGTGVIPTSLGFFTGSLATLAATMTVASALGSAQRR